MPELSYQHGSSNAARLSPRQDMFDRLHRSKSRAGSPSWGDMIERLLATTEVPT